MNIISIPSSEYKVRVSADASFAPGGDISRTGVVIRVADVIVHGSSNNQSRSTLSAHAAECHKPQV